MVEEKDTRKNQSSESKEHIVPGHIKGKINVPDTRERKDGPGGD